MSSKVRDQRVQCTVPGCFSSSYQVIQVFGLIFSLTKMKRRIRYEKSSLKKTPFIDALRVDAPFRVKHNLLSHLSKRHDIHQQQAIIEILV